MTNPTLQFRPAQPSDAPIAVRLIYDAAPEQYDFFFDIDRPTILDFLGKVFGKRSGVFGYQRYTVATLDEKVVAIGAFYDSAHPSTLPILQLCHLCADKALAAHFCSGRFNWHGKRGKSNVHCMWLPAILTHSGSMNGLAFRSSAR